MVKTILITFFISLVSFSAYAQSLEEKVDFLAAELEKVKGGGASGAQLNFGGYGEIVYQNTRSELENGDASNVSPNPTTDAKRFILFIGYDFNKKWKLVSEVEIEHVNEIFLEQAFLDYTFAEDHHFQIGLLLIPVGIINLKHESTTFFSVDRPKVENRIIPTTWRENGLGFAGRFEKFDYGLYLINSLNAAKFSSEGVRGGRQKGGETFARNFAWTGRLDYRLKDNIMFGVSGYRGGGNNTATKITHSVADIHYEGVFGGLHTRALYVATEIDKADELSRELGLESNEGVSQEMSGYYVELGYNILHGRSDWQLIPFTRFEEYDTQEKVGQDFIRDRSMAVTNITYGLAAKPVDNLILKLDYVISKNSADTGAKQWNLGVGWNF